MNNKKGYLLLEIIVSLSIIMTILLFLYSTLLFCTNNKSSIEDKVEVQQQGIETSKHIKSTIEKSKGIISFKFDGFENVEEDGISYKSVSSIKCRYKSDLVSNNTGIKNKEISFKRGLNKVFINTLNNSNQSEPGGYEIGDYVENIYVSDTKDNEFIDIKLKLRKNKEVYETKYRIYIRNFEGGV
ncbi:MAG: hypothetical protein ACRDD7_08155 [Peptostreptococcaceae bacterium]